MHNLHKIYEASDIQIRAIKVPGGVLMITDTSQESRDGIAVALATTFVSMDPDERVAFLKEGAE